MAVTVPSTTTRQDSTQRKRTLSQCCYFKTEFCRISWQTRTQFLAYPNNHRWWMGPAWLAETNQVVHPHITCRGEYLSKTPIPLRREERMSDMHSTGPASYQSRIHTLVAPKRKPPLASAMCVHGNTSWEGAQSKRGTSGQLVWTQVPRLPTWLQANPSSSAFL